MMRTDFAVALRVKAAQDLRRSSVGRDRMRDDVRGTHAMPQEKIMQCAERVDVLEFLVDPGLKVPLIVALGINRDEQGRMRLTHRS